MQDQQNTKLKVNDFLASQEKCLKNQKNLLNRFAFLHKKYCVTAGELALVVEELKLLGVSRVDLEKLFEIDKPLATKIFKRRNKKKENVEKSMQETLTDEQKVEKENQQWE